MKKVFSLEEEFQKLEEQTHSQQSEIESQQSAIDSQRSEIAILREQIKWLKKKLFGTGKSEKFDTRQLELALEHAEAVLKAETPVKETITYERDKPGTKKRQSKEERYEHLPIKETIVIIPDEVKAAPDQWEEIDEETTFEIDITKPELFKRLIVRKKYRHKTNRSLPPVIAPAPEQLTEGGMASAGLLSWIMICKYLDHLPLYRQEKMFKRWGTKLSRQTLARWVDVVSQWLKPIYNQMYENLITGGYLQADETPINYNDPDIKKGKAERGWLWLISRPGADVVFDWRLSRRHNELTTLLKDFKGLLQSDFYGAYESFDKNNDEVIWLGCWAHVRRKFCDAQEYEPLAANYVLRLIGHLYHNEKKWNEQKVRYDRKRAQLRQSENMMTLKLLRKVIYHLIKKNLPRSKLGMACAYALNHWKELQRYCEYGQTRIDNNLAENAVRPTAVGKKNWLFIGHPKAGQRSAIIYSIIISCQRRGIDPGVYIKDVLSRLPNMKIKEVVTIIPGNWKPIENK